MGRFDNHVVIVTGGGSGIGAAETIRWRVTAHTGSPNLLRMFGI